MGGICLAFLLLGALQLHGVIQTHGLRYQDFFGLWSFAQFCRDHSPLALYQPVPLNLYQQALGPGFTGFYPYPYPPDFLLPLWPLRGLAYWPARLIWTALSAALFGWAIWRGVTGPRLSRALCVALALAAPASLSCLMTGETGFFTSALLLGGLLLLPRRPLLAGLCFGLLSLKPQLCVLLPFALAGAGAWRTAAAALLTALALAAASCLVLPAAMWPAWWEALQHYQALTAQNAAQLAPLMTTLTATAQTLGLTGGWRAALQLSTLAAAGAICFALFRRGPRTGAIAALLAATFAVTPHAFFYDAPVAIFSLLNLPWRGRFLWCDILLGLIAVLPLFAGTAVMLFNPAGLLFAALFLRLAWAARAS